MQINTLKMADGELIYRETASGAKSDVLFLPIVALVVCSMSWLA
jgi:hypothetical protein